MSSTSARCIPLAVAAFVCLVVNPCYGLYSSSSPDMRPDASSFKTKVVKGDGPAMVEFFADWCGHCKALAPEYEKAAKALKGIVNVVAVDDQSTAGEYGVKGYPTLKWFPGGGASPKDYNGARTAAGIVEFVTKEVASLAKDRLGGKKSKKSSSSSSKGGGGGGKSEVIVLTDKSFDEQVMKDTANVWFVEFYAPWCGHCKSLEPIWDEASREVKGKKVKLGKVDATTETSLAKRFGIQGFPTLKLFPQGEKKDILAQDYDGGRTASAIVEHALKFAASQQKAEQLLSDEQFNEECAKGLCILAFLPHILDSKADGRNAYLKDLDNVVKSSTTMPVKFFWLQGGDQYELEEQMNLQFGWPAVVAINKEKEKYAIHRGGFETQPIRQFLTGLMSGRQPVEPLPKDLKKFAKVKAWDGKEEELPKEENDEL